jgi:hypothetical protein
MQETAISASGPGDDPNAHWDGSLARLIDEIEAAPVARRRPRGNATRVVRPAAADSLRLGLTRCLGAFLVRHYYRALGFNERRLARWRLEHKLVQYLVLEHYTPGVMCRSVGLGTVVERARSQGRDLREALGEALPPPFLVKRALSQLSGEHGRIDHWAEVLDLHGRGELPDPPGPAPQDEIWVAQRRVSIVREYRVHTVEDLVVPRLTYERYGYSNRPPGIGRVDCFAQGILDRLPDGLVAETVVGWDIAEADDGRLWVIEINFGGYHPVYYPGFHCSGFFQSHRVGPAAFATLLDHAARVYNVDFDPSELQGDLFPRESRVIPILESYLIRRREAVAVPPPAEPHRAASPECLDAVVHVRAAKLERFELLWWTLEAFFPGLGTCWVAVPDDDFREVSARLSSTRCVPVREGELWDGFRRIDGQFACRSQVARLALASRARTEFLLDLTPDALCIKPLRVVDLVRNGQGLYFRSMHEDQDERGREAERLLGIRPSGWVFANAPCVYRREPLLRLPDRIENQQRGLAKGDGSPDWRRALLREPWFQLSTLYFTLLEPEGLDELWHVPAHCPLVGGGVWDDAQWESWEPAKIFRSSNDFYFTNIRVSPAITAEAIRRRVEPFLK